MTIPFLQSGQQYRLKAPHFNAFAQAANAYSSTELQGGGDVLPTQWQTDVRLIQNDSPDDAAAGDVLAIEGVVITPEDAQVDTNWMRWPGDLVFSGVKPDLLKPIVLYPHVGHFAVLLEPIPKGKQGLAVFSGIVTAPINLVYYEHPFADVAHDTRQLTSNWYGAAEILYTQEWPVDSGKFYAAVKLSNFQSTELEVVISQSGGIAANGSGLVDVYWRGVVTNPLQSETAYLHWMHGGNAVAEGKQAIARYDRDKQQWRIRNVEC
jgi:hypothetical protein